MLLVVARVTTASAKQWFSPQVRIPGADSFQNRTVKAEVRRTSTKLAPALARSSCTGVVAVALESMQVRRTAACAGITREESFFFCMLSLDWLRDGSIQQCCESE